MNCAEFDIVLADYVDNTLAPEVRAQIEQHAAVCAGCEELLRDVTGAVSFMSRVAEVEPPPNLVTRIAFQMPMGRTREPFESPGWVSRLVTNWLRPILQPRLAMGMAMTILSFAMLERCTGVRVQHIQAADLSPIRIWGGFEDRAIRVKDRAVKYYENIRLVYEVETRLRELEENRQPSAKDNPQQRKRAANQGEIAR
jgi:Putative zinc-finger